MTTVLNKKIVGHKIVKNDNEEQHVDKPIIEEKPKPTFNETIERPDALTGTTYKIKTPASPHAIYIVINNILFHGDLRPYEIFINSKNVEHFQWVIALTRMISAIWRKGGDAVFLVDELKSVFDPQGGYWHKGKYVNSVVAGIGLVIEEHLKGLGLIEGLPVETKQFIESKTESKTNFMVCPQCQEKAALLLDNCLTCTSCGYSKCG